MTKTESLTQHQVHSLLSYDRESGVFTWRVSPSPFIKAGTVAGCPDRDNYLRIRINGKKLAAHRLAWLYVQGHMPEVHIDHINGIRTDNRFVNLREATNAENGQNQVRPRSNNTTGYLGVSRSHRRFRAEIAHRGKRIKLGYFDSPEEAHEAYKKAKREVHPFGRL